VDTARHLDRVGDDEIPISKQTIIGSSLRISHCLDCARKSANSRSTILLLGESGTGKENFARAIHAWSERRSHPFVAINCVGLSKDLLESELFGHERGAFTGAHQLKMGKIELAHGGTVLLDEIGDIAPDLQTKLLRFLQEREFERVGGVKPIRVDVRIVAATNQKLHSLVKAGRFREDLFYRLNVVCINLPPLRERKEDIRDLARHFLNKFSLESGKQFSMITDDAMQKLCAYDWPGNVRELANVIEQAIVLGRGPAIKPADLPPQVLAQVLTGGAGTLCYRDALNGFRKELVNRALTLSGGNQAAAARILGLHRKYLQRLIKSLHSA
jgi:transcriptional regulator with PAS, ATPase and Fis domain